MRLSLGYDTVSALILLVFFAGLFVWIYKKYFPLYIQFRSVPILYLILKDIFTGKVPKDFPLTSFCFQRIVEILREHQSEGVCVFWSFKPYLIIYSDDALKLFSDAHVGPKRASDVDVLREVLGNGLITSNVDLWRQRRKMLDPAFNTLSVKEKIPIFNKHASDLVKELQKVSNESSIDILKYFKIWAFSNICDSILGQEMNDPDKKDEIQAFLHAVNNLSEMVIKRILGAWLRGNGLWLVPWRREYLRSLEQFRSYTAKVLQEMKERVVSANSQANPITVDEFCTTYNRRSLAHTLVEFHLKDPSFTMKDMQDEISTLIVAGYDTTAHALLWSSFMLGHHPEVQNKLYNELKEATENEDLSYDDLFSLTYLDCVVKETFRLYPPIPLYGRCLEEDVQCGKYTVPSGTTIGFIPFVAHRDPKIYPDPEKFNPERFLDGTFNKKTCSYTPFAEGIRSCIGKKLALMEMKIVLCHIVRNFKITSLDRIEDVDLKWNVVLAPVKPVKMRMTPRHD